MPTFLNWTRHKERTLRTEFSGRSCAGQDELAASARTLKPHRSLGPKLRTQVVRLGHCGRVNKSVPTIGTGPILAVNFAEEKKSRPALRAGGVACTPEEKSPQLFWQVGLREIHVSITQRLPDSRASGRWQNLAGHQHYHGKGATDEGKVWRARTGLSCANTLSIQSRCTEIREA